MASSKEYLNFILEQLSLLNGITWRGMMGEYIKPICSSDFMIKIMCSNASANLSRVNARVLKRHL